MSTIAAPSSTFPEIPYLDEGDFSYVGHGLYAGVVVVTPEMAEAWLEQRNPRNRRITESTVATYSRMMAEGLWVLNGEALIFDCDGNGKDFQHRLKACVKANRPFATLVVVGVDPDAMRTINTGLSRSGGAVLGISGIENSYAVAGMAGWVYRYKHQLPVSAKVAPPQVEDVLKDHPSLPSFASRTLRDARNFPHSLYGGLAYMFSLVDADAEADFSERPARRDWTGEGRPDSHAARSSDSQRLKHTSATPEDVVGLHHQDVERATRGS